MKIYVTILECFSVLSFFFVLEHAEVTVIAALAYIVFLNGFPDSTVGLMCMSTISELAILRESEYLLKIPAYLLWLHIERSETFDSWSVDSPSSERQTQHLAERGGVHSGVMGIADFRSLQINSRYELV